MKFTLNGKEIEADGSKTVLELCRERGIKVPTLCYHASMMPEARCRVCLVELNGKLVTSCSTKPTDGCIVTTESEKIGRARKFNMELMLPQGAACSRVDDYEVCEIYNEVGLLTSRFKPLKEYKPDLGASVVRDNNKCVNCGRCVKVCGEIQAVYAIDFASRGHYEHVAPYVYKPLADVACIKCGQGILNCPVGAITERSHLEEVMAALKDGKKHVVAQAAPSVRAAL
ncbi:MAG: 2Fe-2S iron-sulfur cluster-binding protein, partial [Candidatus Micrarchaeia archaeon]